VTKVTAWARPRWVRGAPASRRAFAGAGGQGRGHAGNDAALDAGLAAGFQLLAASAEDEGVAALEPHDGQAVQGEGDQHRVDLVLGVRMAQLALGHRDPPRRLGRQVQDLVGDQAVMDHHVGGLQGLERLEGQQFRVARPRAHQPDSPGGPGRFPAQDHKAIGPLRSRLTIRHRISFSNNDWA
jgi:hypothetical protein